MDGSLATESVPSHVEAPQRIAGERAAAPCRIEPDLEFKKVLAELGTDTFNRCMQCANCSMICALSPQRDPFPRKEMMWMMWGLKDRLVRDADIWACHYCGNCSQRCPGAPTPERR